MPACTVPPDDCLCLFAVGAVHHSPARHVVDKCRLPIARGRQMHSTVNQVIRGVVAMWPIAKLTLTLVF